MKPRQKPYALSKSRHIISILTEANSLLVLQRVDRVNNLITTLHFGGPGYAYECALDTGNFSKTTELFNEIKDKAPIDIQLYMLNGQMIGDLEEKAKRLDTICISYAKLLTTFKPIPVKQLNKISKIENLKCSISAQIQNLSSNKIQKINNIILEKQKSKSTKSLNK